VSKIPSPEVVRKHLDPYATEIGHIAISWNRLHENLALLFWHAIGPGGAPFAIWNTISSDRTQREILKAAVEANAFNDRPDSKRISQDVLWLLKQADKLSDQRNDALHGPITTLTDTATGETRVAPQTFFGNRRAKKLDKKDLMNEFNWYRESIEALSRYAADLVRERPTSTAWPKRPQLPKLAQKSVSRN
jgi:hypothetical protein